MTKKRHDTASEFLEAAKKADSATIYRMLKSGVSANTANRQGVTALHMAAFKGHVRIARILLLHRANIDAADMHGETPLHRATCKSRYYFAEFLLENGAGIDAADNAGRTPLHRASAMGEAQVAALLLSRKANADARDRNGSTPLHLAALAHDRRMVELLLDFGATPSLKNASSHAPEDLWPAIKSLVQEAAERAAAKAEADLPGTIGEIRKKQQALGGLRPKGPSL